MAPNGGYKKWSPAHLCIGSKALASLASSSLLLLLLARRFSLVIDNMRWLKPLSFALLGVSQGVQALDA